ncbi:MAG: LamG-like jellyroll fold domain-containing protein [Armatimonadota bacterium]
MKAILVIAGIIFCFVFAGFASASDFTQYRGASLDNPLHANWPCAAGFWNTAVWPENKTAKDEVHEYLDRMQSDGFNAVRKLLWVTSDVDWSPATQDNLCEFLDMVQSHQMKAMIWIAFVVPAFDDDSKGDPNGNDGKVMPDGSVPSPCLRQRSDNPALFDAVVAQGKRDVDKIIGYVAAKRPAHPAIIGWSVGNGEDPFSISSAEFVRELAPYVRRLDPFHPIGMEVYTGKLGVMNGQILMLPNGPGRKDPRITARDVYSCLDYIGVANYDLYDGVDRGGLTPIQTFLDQLQAQNPENKPLYLEEYGNVLGDDPRGIFLSQLTNTSVGQTPNWQAAFVWNAHAWNMESGLARNQMYAMFNSDAAKPYCIGAGKAYTRVVTERYITHPWASYNFDDNTSPTVALDGECITSLTLANGASKGAGRTGKGLVLDGVDDYAWAAGNGAVMDHPYFYFEAWIKPTELRYGTVASRTGAWEVSLNADGLIHIFANTGSGWSAKGGSTDTVPTNAWTHIGVGYDGKYWRYYINGKLDSECLDAGSIAGGAANPLQIGAGGDTQPYNYFKGSIDEVQISPEPGPLVRYACDELYSPSLSDSSGNGLDANLYGGCARKASVLPDGTCIEFDGNSGYAVAPTVKRATGQVCVDFYMLAHNTASGGSQCVLSQGSDSPGSGWNVFLRDKTLRFAVNTSNGAAEAFVPMADEGVWHHVRAGYDGKTARISLDGVEGTSQAGTGPIVYRNSENLTLGRMAYPEGRYYFDGALDEIEVYTTARGKAD